VASFRSRVRFELEVITPSQNLCRSNGCPACLSFGHKNYLLASRSPQRLTGIGVQYSVSTGTVSGTTHEIRSLEITRHLMWKIRTLALIMGIVLLFGSTPVLARGGGHGGGHSGGHGGHSGGHRGHHEGRIGDRHGRITSGTTARGHFINQHPCPSTDKTLADCPQLGELQTIPAEKANNRFE
jgi:hypothetical protein